jgi:hypothetical protein
MIPKSGTACYVTIMMFTISNTDTHTHTQENCGGHNLNMGQSSIGERWGKRDKSFIDNYFSVVVERC